MAKNLHSEQQKASGQNDVDRHVKQMLGTPPREPNKPEPDRGLTGPPPVGSTISPSALPNLEQDPQEPKQQAEPAQDAQEEAAVNDIAASEGDEILAHDDAEINK